MSPGAVVLMIALVRCAGSSDCKSVRAASSSAPRIRSPFFGPSRTSAGLLPKNDGDEATSVPFTIVKCSDTWCPSTRQPHVAFADGVPKIEKKYFSGSRSSTAPGGGFGAAARSAASSPRSTISRSMIDVAVM
jgi:hypothetical protein